MLIEQRRQWPLAHSEAVITDVTNKYKTYSATAIANASKKTAPFRRAHQGDVLSFSSLGPSRGLGGSIDPVELERLLAEPTRSLEEMRFST